MLRRMRKTFVACLAAGAVGVGASLALSTDVGVPVSASQAKLEAMKVELAWLADARAFNLTLQVLPTADGLELRGHVPDDATRQHVLKLARQACYLPVRDALEMGKPCVNPALRDAARAAIAAALSTRAAKIAVSIEQPGVVMLTGSVTSVEEKLDAARPLRGVTGCTRVDNRLEVTPVQRGGATLTPISRDGKKAVPGPVAPSPVVNVRADVPVEPKEKLKGDPLPPLPSDPKPANPSNLRIYSGEKAGIVLPPAPTPVLPSGPPTMQFVRIQVRHEALEPNARPLLKPLISGYASGAKVTADGLPGYPTCPTCEPDVTLSAPRVSPPPTIIGRIRGILAPAKADNVHPKPLPRPTPAVSPVRVITDDALPPPIKVASVEVTVPAAAPAVWPPAYSTPGVTPYKPEAVPAPVATAPAPTPPVVTPVAAKVEKVTPVASKVEKPAAPPALTPEQMRKAIAAGCGKLVKEVKVEARPDGQAIYHIHASAKVEQDLVTKLLSIPQVVSSNAHLQIHLTP